MTSAVWYNTRHCSRYRGALLKGLLKGKIMKIWIELHNRKERTYENVTRVDDDPDGGEVKIYSDKTLLAIINKRDLKSLLTEKE